jgi:hypothetical protein
MATPAPAVPPTDTPAIAGVDEAQRASDRQTVKRWLREQMLRLGHSPVHFGALTSLSPDWLTAALDQEHLCCPSVDVVQQICRALRVPASDAVTGAARRLTNAARPPQRLAIVEHAARQAARIHPGPRKPLPRAVIDVTPLPARCSTAELELSELVRRAAAIAWPHDASRNLALMRQRLGLGGSRPMTLAEVGDPVGLSRERVRQFEEKLLAVIDEKLSSVDTPHVDSLLTEFTMASGIGVDAFADQFASLIGDASPIAILTLAGRIRHVDALQDLQQISIGRDQSAAIIGTARDAELAHHAAIIGRRLQRYAGAVSVDALRRRVEETLGGTVDLKALYQAVGLLPAIRWLDTQHCWYYQFTEPTSNVVRTAAEIGFIARRAMRAEDLYAGLVREARRIGPEEIAENGPAVPPVDVLIRLLEFHPHFRKRYASAIEYIGPAVDLASSDSMRDFLVKRFNSSDGVATYWDLREAAVAKGYTLFALRGTLYTCGWFERVSAGVHALRGRQIDPQDLLDAEHRAAKQLGGRKAHRQERNAARALARQPKPEGDTWTIKHQVTTPLPSHGVLAIDSATVPPQMSGNYRLPCGHALALIDSNASATIRNVGVALREALSLVGREIEFEFDGKARTVTYRVIEEAPPL